MHGVIHTFWFCEGFVAESDFNRVLLDERNPLLRAETHTHTHTHTHTRKYTKTVHTIEAYI